MDIQAAARATPTPGSTDPTPSTLAGEHAMLLRDVRGLADPILALVGARCWPEAELRALTRYLRTAVLRQATAEEASFYPASTNAPFAELSAQHVALHTLAERLDNADSSFCSLPQLAESVTQLVIALEHHLAAEQNLLVALEGLHTWCGPSRTKTPETPASGSRSSVPWAVERRQVIREEYHR